MHLTPYFLTYSFVTAALFFFLIFLGGRERIGESDGRYEYSPEKNAELHRIL